MRLRSLSLFLAAFSLTLFISSAHADEAKTGTANTEETKPQKSRFELTIRPFLETHCVRCHGAEQSKGERSFDQLNGRIRDEEALVDYQDILDQLNLGEMPPAEETQPSDSQRRQVVSWLTRRIALFHEQKHVPSRSTVLRRLNAREYRNTVRDLLQLNVEIFDPTEPFPSDDELHHLDNIGETLVTSSFLLSGYLDAADSVITKAIGKTSKPKEQTWKFTDGFRQQPEIDQVHRKTSKFKHMTLYDVIGADKHEGGYGPILDFSQGVPLDGFYEIRFQAEPMNRDHPYKDSFLKRDRNAPFRLGIRPGHREVGSLHLPQPIEPLLAEFDLVDGREWYTAKIWLDEGYTPRFTFRNGLMDARSIWGKAVRLYPQLFPEKVPKGIVAARFNAIKHGKLPHIRIHEIHIRGPISPWPTASQANLFGEDWEQIADSKSLTNEQTHKHLSRFMSLAYRRPAQEAEVQRIMKVVRARSSEDHVTLGAFADGLKAVLCSPNFLYLDEGNEGELSPHALANRLSYFLWSSMPDRELRRLADNGELGNDKVLLRQVERMLDDPKSEAFVDGFLDSWLTLGELGSAPPDRKDFEPYYQFDLGTAMREETRRYMKYLIQENRSLIEFLDSDYTFANGPLAKLYGLETDPGFEFQKVNFKGGQRGGLLGQASILTVSANGVDTSPIVRGVWLLENILGTPPTPPPPDVEPLDPDVRGAKTIRDQLEKHRTLATCNECHKKIDPLGFALENFDPIGRWRDKYKNKSPIDASGKLPGGKSFENVKGLKQLLVGQQDLFVRSVTSKMMSYATGRTMTVTDRPALDRIVQRLSESGLGTRELIREIVASSLFRRK